MKKLLFIYTLLCLILPVLCLADDAGDYYILHETKLLLKEIPIDLKGQEREAFTEKYSREGFNELANPGDSLVACGSENCNPGISITFPQISLPPSLTGIPSAVPSVDYPIREKFRVFVPPGTTFLSLTITPKPGKDVRAAVRMNYVPEGGDPATLAYTNQGTYELRYLDYTQVNLKPAGNQISIYSSTPYPLESSVNPLAEDHSGWIYVNVLAGVENIQSINYSFTVNSMIYNPWYYNYYQGSDVYGLDDQSIVPAVAAMAGSQLLQSYGQILSEKMLKELGVMFQDSSGQIVQSDVHSGDGTVIPFGCCKVVCCVGIGVMATPTGVTSAFNSFASSATNRLDQLFKSANQAFYQYWGLPITSEFSKNRTAFSKLMKNQNQVFQDLFVGLGAAQAELGNQEQFGKFSLFGTIRLGKDIAKAAQIQKEAEPQLVSKIYDELETYRHQFASADKVLAYHIGKDDALFKGQNIVDTEGTMGTDQIKASIQISEILLDPYPDIELPEAKKQTRAAEISTFKRMVKKSQLLLSQYLYSENIAEQSPTILTETVNLIRTSMGYSGDPLPEGSRISSKEFMALLVESKFANPNWYTESADKNRYGLTRESLVLKAFALEQELHRLFKLHRQTLLKAQIYAARINHQMNPELNKAFNIAVSQ